MVLIERDGRVSHAEISSIDLTQLDRGRVESSGYVEAARQAVNRWRFPRVSEKCRKEVTITFSLSDD